MAPMMQIGGAEPRRGVRTIEERMDRSSGGMRKLEEKVADECAEADNGYYIVRRKETHDKVNPPKFCHVISWSSQQVSLAKKEFSAAEKPARGTC